MSNARRNWFRNCNYSLLKWSITNIIIIIIDYLKMQLSNKHSEKIIKFGFNKKIQTIIKYFCLTIGVPMQTTDDAINVHFIVFVRWLFFQKKCFDSTDFIVCRASISIITGCLNKNRYSIVKKFNSFCVFYIFLLILLACNSNNICLAMIYLLPENRSNNSLIIRKNISIINSTNLIET